MERELPLDISTWDEQCMQTFIKENAGMFYVFASRYVDDKEAINDFLQEAYIKLWTHRKSIGKVSSIRNYFFSVIKNVILDHWNYFSHPNRIVNEEEYLNVSSNETFVQHIIEAESSRLIAEAIRTLSPQSRRVLELTIEGKNQQEIADILQVSVNTVKTVKYRAIETLSKRLSREDFLLFLFLFCF